MAESLPTFPVAQVHNGWQGLEQEAGKAYMVPPSDPTYTIPLATAGVDSISNPVGTLVQNGNEVRASNALRSWQAPG